MAANNPKDFEDISHINRQQRLLQRLEEHKFPSGVEDQLMNTDFGSYFLEGDQLVNYNSPFTGYSGRQVWQTVKNTVSSCLGWLADQLIAFKPWLLQQLSALSSKKFLIVSGIVVFSAVAGSFHFYYKESAMVEQGEPTPAPTYDPIICIICNDSPRSHMFVPCGHMVTCSKCTEFFANQERDCPMCRTVITNSVKVHLS